MLLQFFKKITKFLLFTAVFYVMILILWQTFFPNVLKRNMLYLDQDYLFSNNTFAEVKNKKNIDILFLGSSHAYRGFDPRIFKKHNWECFNLGTSSQTPIQTEFLLKKYLDQLNPKLIVYDVYLSSFSSDGVESCLDVLVNEKISNQTLKMVLKTNAIKSYNAFVYLWLKQLFFDHPDVNVRIKTTKDQYVGNGYVKSNLMINPDTIPLFADSLPMLEKQKLAFDRIVKKIKTKNIPLLLVQVPVTKKYNKTLINRNKMEHYFKNKSAYYYNFNQLLNLSDSLHFFDYHHLNQQGVRIFNNSLIKIIKQKNILQP